MHILGMQLLNTVSFLDFLVSYKKSLYFFVFFRGEKFTFSLAFAEMNAKFVINKPFIENGNVSI